MSEDFNQPGFWNKHYLEGNTPWDCHGVTRRLLSFLESAASRGRVLIPGCGSGCEVKAFLDFGFDVLAIDFAEAAVAQARRRLGAEGHRVIQADFFSHDFGKHPFDLIYERTFLTALPPERRADYARIMASLLPAGGRLIGYFFHGPEEEPPPYPISESELRDLLKESFSLVNNEPVPDSLPLFEGKERWMEWEKRSGERQSCGWQ